MKSPCSVSRGERFPLGATIRDGGINFCLFSREATAVSLLLYERPDSPEPFQVVELDPQDNRTYFFWHVFVRGLRPGEHVSYTWRVDGPQGPGLRFDPEVELLDPWARAVTHDLWRRKYNREPPGAGHASSMRAMVTDVGGYDWEGDQPLRHPREQEIIYELHVGGFTRNPNSGLEPGLRGTFHGLIEKIPYLQDLGVTAVELMPVMAFDEQDVPDAVRDRGLKNYWGYATHSFFCPHPGYCRDTPSGTHADEFRDMVKALHRAGISVILDVVYNHTAEGGADGPVINFKGMMNQAFYHLEEHDPDQYKNYSGCGNTVNCNHPLVSRFIISSLEYWVREFHVDGFRFDLASILARGEDGAPMAHAPVVWGIEFSPVLAHTRLIAEAWDAGGLYQVGAFPGFRWGEWNGRFRDVVRRFVRGDQGMVPELATRMAGSSDLYQASGRLPLNSVNFITCHDGFTLHDLVSYNEKHNQANGEGNRDGDNHNLSWNCGAEGESADPAVLELRRRQARNFMAILLLSQGVPMILAGDEVLRSQQGNNNCYCQDNELSWFDWGLVEKNADMLRFTREMIRLRRRHPCLMRRRFLDGRVNPATGLPEVAWHGARLHDPPLDDPKARLLAFTLYRTRPEEEDLHVILNMDRQEQQVELPQVEGRRWRLAVDTAQASPDDIVPPARQRPWRYRRILAQPHSVLVLESR